MVWNLIIILLGLVMGRLLFARFPVAGGPGIPVKTGNPGDISVIIPARNEEKTLPLLLEDLRRQTRAPLEILCVNDGSTDGTRQAALLGGARLLDVMEKPEDFIGKSYACLTGARAASGARLLFLDADVRLAPDALEVLAGLEEEAGCTVSVQPYHKMERPFEQWSFFFNLIQVGANGACLPRPGRHVGLFGPVILMPRRDYDAVGGHETVRRSIADDLALGRALSQKGRPYQLYLGGARIAYRMYAEGFAALLRGWTKNVATGAAGTPLSLLLPVFFFVTSCFSAPLNLVFSLSQGNPEAFGYAALWGVWMLELFRIARRMGNFKGLTLVAYPLPQLLFILVFLWSVLIKMLNLNVKWKGRKIRPES